MRRKSCLKGASFFFYFFLWKENIVFFLHHFRRWCSSTWWGPHILCAVHTVVISGKTPLYDCVGWLFSQLENDGCANGFLNASHSFNVFLILVFQFLGWKSSQFRDCPAKCGTGGHPRSAQTSFIGERSVARADVQPGGQVENRFAGDARCSKKKKKKEIRISKLKIECPPNIRIIEYSGPALVCIQKGTESK